MHPILFKIHGFPIHTYGVMIALGFLAAVFVAKREAIRVGLPPDRIVDLAFWALLIGMLGARILYIITMLPYYFHNPIEMFYVWEGGLVFFGGLLTCIPFFLWYTQRYSLNRWKVLDLFAMCMPLAHAFGRIGCLSAGCCYGRPTNAHWGIKLYSDLVAPNLRGIYLYPTQLMSSVSLFILFIFLYRMRRTKKFDGQVAFTYLIAYSIIRSIIEIFRGDAIRGFVIPNILSTSQFIAIFVVIGAVYFYRKRKREALCLPKTS